MISIYLVDVSLHYLVNYSALALLTAGSGAFFFCAALYTQT